MSDATISRSNPHPKADGPGAPPTPKAAPPPALDRSVSSNSTDLAIMSQELTSARSRITDLEKQLAAEQSGRRADLERLLREQMELVARNATLEAELKHKDAGQGS